MVYNFTGKQHRIRNNNDIYITSEMALVYNWYRGWNINYFRSRLRKRNCYRVTCKYCGGTLIRKIKMHEKRPVGITMDNLGHVYVGCSKTKETVILTRDLRDSHVSRTVISTPEAIEYSSIRHELLLSCKLRSSIGRFSCKLVCVTCQECN